jgi:lysophospholipase L1-like esterase
VNTNPNAKVVLCYGDSNTWGRLPDRSGRYAVDERWTGQLQKLLGDDYYVIEEGLGGRTTDLDDRGA